MGPHLLVLLVLQLWQLTAHFPPTQPALTPRLTTLPPPLPQVEAIMKLFDRWARLLEEAPQEKVHAPFVTELQAAGFLKVGRRGAGNTLGRALWPLRGSAAARGCAA